MPALRHIPFVNEAFSTLYPLILFHRMPVAHRKLFYDLFSVPLCHRFLISLIFVGLISSEPPCACSDLIGFTIGGMKQSAFRDQLSFHRKASSKIAMVLIMQRQVQILKWFSSRHDKYKYCDGSHHAKPNVLIAECRHMKPRHR